jgi:protoporphyrin/coproporphyrin ferrochelatase
MVLAPHYSGLSIAKYHAKIRTGLEMYDGAIDVAYIDSYHDAPGYIRALVNRVREGIARWPEPERDAVHVVLSAHSLPERILKMGDPYQDQLLQTARLVAGGAGLRDDQWSWSYQSAGRSPEPWLGPQIEEHIPVLAARGVRSVVSVPIGFVCDHVEILYDIDIGFREFGKELGLRVERTESLNESPTLTRALADLAQRALARLAAHSVLTVPQS